jgi:hypothetical protein
MQWICFSKICQTLFQDLKPYNQEEVKYGFIFCNVGFCLVFWVRSIVRRNEGHWACKEFWCSLLLEHVFANRDSLSPEVCGMYPPLSGIEPTTATTCTNCSTMLVQLIVIYHKQQKYVPVHHYPSLVGWGLLWQLMIFPACCLRFLEGVMD